MSGRVHPLARRYDRLPGDCRLRLHYRIGLDAGAEAVSSDPLARDSELAVIEGLLFAADEPLPTRKLAQAAGLADASVARRLLKKLQALYERDGTAFRIEELAGGFQLLTRPE